MVEKQYVKVKNAARSGSRSELKRALNSARRVQAATHSRTLSETLNKFSRSSRSSEASKSMKRRESERRALKKRIEEEKKRASERRSSARRASERRALRSRLSRKAEIDAESESFKTAGSEGSSY